MKKMCAILLAAIPVFLLSVFLALPAALAAGATSVTVDGVTLTASVPYLEKGSTVATVSQPASGMYSYFDAATSTLTLKDTVINTPSRFIATVLGAPYDSHSLINAEGDLTLILNGTNELYYHQNEWFAVFGVAVNGALTVDGSGSLSIQISNTAEVDTEFHGFTTGNLTIHSGTLNVSLNSNYISTAFSADGSVLITGGDITLDASGTYNATGILNIDGVFRMTGGKISATSTAMEPWNFCMYARQVQLEGGQGRFIATNAEDDGTALYLSGVQQTYSGGTFVFSGTGLAMVYAGLSGNASFAVSNGNVYVSRYASGSGMSLWTSDADGALVYSRQNHSDFKYVQFGGTRLAEMPQTGDSATPWLWLGIAAVAVAGIAVLIIILHKKKTGR
ncbi:MAG TPA: LPXTG cell wall anchor domain-containing protein [Candidatus Limiplasma sp.]|nr:LPXTG cell wall anchor domain-containing protein [Candidatus Limiplasma sp.]